MYQLFTLRNHKASVTCIASFKLDEVFLVSGDKDGMVIVWDVAVRRNKYIWQGHTDSILSILQWNQYLITQARDSSVKIWNFGKNEPEEVLDIPINSLNFCNIAMFSNYLFTPATVDSNNFDCYKIDQDLTISRVIANFDCYKLVHGDVIEINPDANARNDFGIIMKLHYVSDYLIVAFESGDLVVLKVDWNNDVDKTSKNNRLILNKDPRVSLVYHNSTHSPNPVTCVSFNQTLFSGSTNKTILNHNIKDNTSQAITLNNAGVLQIIVLDNTLIVGFWNGLIEIRYGTNEPYILSRSTPSESLLDTPKANIKLSSLFLYHPQAKPQTKNSYRNIIKSKRNINSPILFAGYEDGIIAAYSIPVEPLTITEME